MQNGKPDSVANILAELMARRGYARLQSLSSLQDAWAEAAGKALATQSRPGRVRGGKLEVIVTSSLLVQELTFRKQELITRLNELAADEGITDLKFRVGPIN